MGLIQRPGWGAARERLMTGVIAPKIGTSDHFRMRASDASSSWIPFTLKMAHCLRDLC